MRVLAKTLGSCEYFHLGERRIHHEDEADGDGQIGSADRERREERFRIGYDELAKENPESHRCENPDREIPVKEGHLSGDGFSHGEPVSVKTSVCAASAMHAQRANSLRLGYPPAKAISPSTRISGSAS